VDDVDRIRARDRHAYLMNSTGQSKYSDLPIRLTTIPDMSVSGDYGMIGGPAWISMLQATCEVAANRRSENRREYDHCPVDTKSLFRRIELIASCGDAQGSLLCIGDNDHITPVAARLCRFADICVVDFDDRVLQDVASLNALLGGQHIECIKLDIRKADQVADFIKSYDRNFTTITSDPPYTTAGFINYLHLAIRTLRMGGAIHLVAPYMLFEDWSVVLLHEIQTFYARYGVVVTDMWRGAQTFQVGAGVVSSIIRAERRLLDDGSFEIDPGSFYTLEKLWTS
jgi:predicted methyltransferase